MSLDNKVAIVAGASRGIGTDIARYLGQAGAKVAVAARTETQRDPRLPGTIHSVTQQITDEGGTALPVVLNMRDPESIRAAMTQVANEWGSIDILVNNAAIFVPGDLETVQERHINLSIEVNMRSYILTMREVVPHMRAAGRGHIINISSRGAIPLGPGPYTEEQRNRGGDIFYGAEKIALEHFSQRQAAMLQEGQHLGERALAAHRRAHRREPLRLERPRAPGPELRDRGRHGAGDRLDLRAANAKS